MQLFKKEIAFFSGIRFGLRKINRCMLKNSNLLNDYFEPRFFQLFSLGDGSQTKLFNAKDCIAYNKYNVNLTRVILSGEYKGEDVYQIILDSDIYVLGNEEIDSLLEDEKALEQMNNILFEIYKQTITEHFIEILQMDENNDENMMEIEENE